MSSSRATGLSLSQSLRSSISQLSESTIKTLKKDTNNLAGANKKIKGDACKEYLKEYKKYIDGEIDSVKHPVTGKPLTRKERIDFIAEQCRTAFDLSLSGSKSSKSSDSSGDDGNVYKLLKPLTFKDIDTILEYPTKQPNSKKVHLLSLFRKKITEEEATKILKAYLEDESITDENVVLYRKIRTYMRENFLSEEEYNPFISSSEFKKTIRNKYYSISSYTQGQDAVNRERVDNIIRKTKEIIDETLTYGDNNKNADDFKRNTVENYYKYYAIEFMLLQLRSLYGSRDTASNAQNYLDLIDKFIEGKINITDPDGSISFEKSRSWSTSPEDPILKAEYKTNKEKELARIMDTGKEYAGSINDADFYTMEEWSDMSLRKLKNVIVIPYEENGKIYANAYYVKSLYTAWYMAVKDYKPFLNPANRKEFRQEDKNKILEVIQDLYPGLKAPRYGSKGGRNDIIVNYINNYDGRYSIKVNFRYQCSGSPNNYCLYNLIIIGFPSSFIYADDNSPDDETNVPLAYNPTFLFEMINTLMRRNKIVGKNIPFKIAEPFAEANKKLLDKSGYMRFFDKIRLMI